LGPMCSLGGRWSGGDEHAAEAVDQGLGLGGGEYRQASTPCGLSHRAVDGGGIQVGERTESSAGGLSSLSAWGSVGARRAAGGSQLRCNWIWVRR